MAAWTLLIFGLLGLVASLWWFSPTGIGVNGLLMVLGWLDIHSLSEAVARPARWRRIAWTQSLLGVIIAGSMAWLGWTLPDSPTWIEAMEVMRQLYGNPPGIEEALAFTGSFFKWAMLAAGGLIIASQGWLAWRLVRMSKVPPALELK